MATWLQLIMHKTNGDRWPVRIVLLILISILGCSNRRGSVLQIRSQHPAPVTFHLLDVDPIAFVMDGGDENTPHGQEVYRTHPRLKLLAGKMNARRFGGYSLSPDVFLFMEQSKRIWERHVIKSGQIETAGNAKVDVRPGNYWLLAFNQKPGAEAFWLQQVDIKDKINDVELRQSNALLFK